MRFGRIRLWLAGLAAWMVGVPLTQKAYGQAGDIIDASIGLGLSIADSAGGS
ncbi:MAG: hypothetical protein ACKVS9_14015 [Phycisphaerae bacterium]